MEKAKIQSMYLAGNAEGKEQLKKKDFNKVVISLELVIVELRVK